MAVHRILKSDESLLRKKAKKVKNFDAGLKALVEDMVETMHSANGVGLAAPQIGVSQRVIVVQLPEDDEELEAGKLFALVNPEIAEASAECEAGEEGCLSVPGFVGEVKRATAVRLKAQTVNGRPIRMDVKGYLARVFQHEIDHLDGVLFIDRVEGPDKLRRITPQGEQKPIEPEPAES